MSRSNRKSVISHLQSPFRRFVKDETGQGIICAAASLLVLIGFVALVFNVGRLTERRTKMQLAADAAVYSGAMVQANSLSAIAWINSAMAQIYYNCVKYAVDVNTTAVAAKLAMLTHPKDDPATLEAVKTHYLAWKRADDNMARAKEWLVDLSRIENAIAILSPRFAQEEMYAVAKQAGAEWLSVFPSPRLFPYNESQQSFLIERLGDTGWQITEIGGQNRMIRVTLEGGEWHLQYSTDGLTTQEVVIQEEPTQGKDELKRWSIKFNEPPGTLTQEILLVQTTNLGWVVWGTKPNPDGSVTPIAKISFDPVDMDGDGYKEGTRVTQGDTSQTYMKGADGKLYVWISDLGRYAEAGSGDEMTIGGVKVGVNVSTDIVFPGATAHIGDPTSLNVGEPRFASVVLTNPPTISASMGGVHISVHGFDPNSFDVSAGGSSLTHGDATGRWDSHYNSSEEAWWRHRLVELEKDAATLKASKWQYDRQTLGAHLQEEPSLARFVYTHAIGDRFGTMASPDWDSWFDPTDLVGGKARPQDWAPKYAPLDPKIVKIRPALENPPDDNHIYYLTEECPLCHGKGYDLNNPNIPCSMCNALDNDGDGSSDVRVFLSDVLNAPLSQYICNGNRPGDDNSYLVAKIWSASKYGDGEEIQPPSRKPLVLTPDFFKYGVNLAAWQEAEKAPMLLPSGREPAWGLLAIASARLGIPDPAGANGYTYAFDYRYDRDAWCNNDPQDGGCPDNLYSTAIQVKLFASRNQVHDFDLDRDILVEEPVADITESSLSYLWNAILGSGINAFTRNTWAKELEGLPDATVINNLRNMRNRQGNRFDFGDQGVDSVIEH